MKKISILGCGWVGKALLDALNTNKYKTICLSRDIEENSMRGGYNCDVLVIAIPPRECYLEVLREALGRVEASTQVILLSSISFYDGKPLVIEAEGLLQRMHEGAVILRLGGLMGYDRIAGKYTAGKVLTSDARTNYVHRDDVVGIIESIIAQDVRDEIFDVVAPIQCSKKEIFAQNTEAFGFEKTEFLSGDERGKVLVPTKLCEHLVYTFLKKDVKAFWQFESD
ncbi:MAG: hypothetical protein COB07_12475 [Sulfurovum sp.]|nr:MAG: hypothetical protein COB07_12475 [Sulfurovum sp.]